MNMDAWAAGAAQSQRAGDGGVKGLRHIAGPSPVGAGLLAKASAWPVAGAAGSQSPLVRLQTHPPGRALWAGEPTRDGTVAITGRISHRPEPSHPKALRCHRHSRREGSDSGSEAMRGHPAAEPI